MEIKIEIEELRKRKLFVATPMYGGQCAGMFAKSCADLSALCAKYGIPLQFYYLFNESLITRARNYCCDEFMRSDASHLMFIDSDIGFDPNDVIALMALQAQDPNYDIIGGPYPKKSVIKSTPVETEDGIKTIEWIIDNRYSGKVKSFNMTTSTFEWNKVTNWFKNSTDPGKRWISLGGEGKKHIWVTDDHECYVLDSVLNPSIYKTEARNVKGKFLVTQESSGNNSLYNKEQLSVMIGTLLGDGSITKNNYLKFGHSDHQKEYLDLKQSIFGGKIQEKRISGTYQSGNLALKPITYYSYGLTCPRNYQINELRSLLYVNGRKTVKNVIEQLDDIGLAFWYMDDGSLKGNAALLCTDDFSLEDHQMIQKKFMNMGIEATIHNYGKHHRIYISASSSNNFFERIAKYVPSHMEYKLPQKYRGGIKHEFNTKRLGYCAVHINTLTYFDEMCDDEKHKKRNLFDYQCDITVEGNHNFVAENYLISNCISWEKIKHAVDKGAADENPNILEKFVGDYVFNPKGGQQSIPISEPVEVLEIGTGFMMITKQAMQKFYDTYKDKYSYKPDHVRTEHFDGTREILMFFQAEVDPVSKRYLSEDYWFCQKAQEIGLKTWFCPWMRLQHVGTYIFGGSLADLASIGVSATADPGMLGNKSKKMGAM